LSFDGIEFWWLPVNADSSDIPYYGTNFHDIPPVYNANTNWEIVPQAVLYTRPDTVTFVDQSQHSSYVPGRTELYQNYPNPFNPVTVINWHLAAGSYVDLSIFNLLGQKVVTLVSETREAGRQQVAWNASGCSSGIYYYQLMAGDYRKVRKMIFIR